MAQKKFYAVKQGRQPGIYTTWSDCQKQTVGYKGAKFKGFVTKEEAQKHIHPQLPPRPEPLIKEKNGEYICTRRWDL